MSEPTPDRPHEVQLYRPQPPAPHYAPPPLPYYPPAQYAPPGLAYPPRPMPTAPPKSPGVAAILSLVFCGLGHLYTGNPLAAVLWFLGAVVSVALMTVVLGFFTLPLVYIGAAIHAYSCAAAFNQRHHAVR